MALSIDDCNKMIITAKKNNVELFVVKQNRFNPPVEVLKKLIILFFPLELDCF